ncbi:hypothetical protein FK519_29015, partial [Klebsiella pneumoniae]|nr:hypothetical protein [Klebsiella pneumoniae]
MELLKKNTSHKDENIGKHFLLKRQFRDTLVENQGQVERSRKPEKQINRKPPQYKKPELTKVKTTKDKSRSEKNPQ